MERKDTKKILVLRFSALGDVAMTMPAIYSVALQHPEVELVVATRPFFSRLFIHAPENVTMLPVDLKQYKGVGGLVRLIRLMLAQQPDCVADLHNMLRTWMIDAALWLTGHRVVMVDKQRRQRKAQKLREQRRPFTQRYFDVFEQLGLKAIPQFASVYDHVAAPALPDFLPAKGEERWVGVAPFARFENKSYPNAYGPELMQRLSQLPGVRVFLFGGKENLADAEAWLAGSDRVVSMIGRTAIEQELALMSRLDLMISMDSANMHLASIAGTRVLSIWGSTTPSCGFLGWNQRPEDALCAGLACQPCTTAGSKHCRLKDLRCMMALTPQKVEQSVKRILYGTE